MKNIIKIATMLLTLSLLSSCSPESCAGSDNQGGAGRNVKMRATVDKVSEKIEVTVIEGEYGAEGIFWVIVGDTTEIQDEHGSPLTPSDIKVGDTVEILYGGQVMMSYPPQIAASKITVLD